MRIKAFTFLVKEHLESYQLENTEVVVDGQNIYYKLYEKSGIPFVLGSESDKFANYVREYFRLLKKANLKCHFIVKAGHDSKKYLDVHFKLGNRLHGKEFVLGENYDNAIIQPCLAKDIYLQVLEEMGFDYIISHGTDVIKECFELAQRLSCPVISFNIQYCFSSVPYVPLKQGTVLEFEQSNHITCGIFKRQNFLQHYRISKEKMILFILLTDSHVLKEDYFLQFFKACKIPYSHIKRYKGLLMWLSRRSEEEALQEVFKYISESDKQTFLDNKNELEIKFLKCVHEESVTSLYFTNRNSLKIDIQDPHWFEKGIALKYIAIPYVNLYFWGIIVASRLVEDYDQENSILFSKDIIKYAYDLLKNFNDKNINIKYREINDSEEISVIQTQSVRKPDYAARKCVFENGWENIDSRGLFEHFFLETYGSFNFAALESAPADVRLLLITLVYFKRNKEDDMSCEIYSIILSYVLLGVVAEKVNHDLSDSSDSIDIVSRPLLDSTTQKDLVTTQDCIAAKRILKEYCTISDDELLDIFNRTKVHPLFQFEWCLLQINNLNKLCGSPYTSTVYSKTYNATFVYKILCKIKGENAIQTITDLLNPAPSVLAFTSGIIEMYEKLLYEY
ncbi:unnamed protein product, partial [Brenthis ino]